MANACIAVVVEKTFNINLTLDEIELLVLRNWVQNPMRENETTKEKDLRATIFNTIFSTEGK